MDRAHFGQGPPWSAIREAIEKTNGRVVAAVSYIGKDAATVLPLGRGDLLVCDASDPTIRGGSTRPEGLRALRARGVEIHSIQGLHAKVVVLPRRSFVGSMNASARSSGKLFEAVLESTDPGIRKQLRTWVEGFQTEPLSRADIARLIELAPKDERKGWPPPAAPAELPMPLEQLLIETTAVNTQEWSRASDRAYEEESPAAQAQARSVLAGGRLYALEYPVGTLRRFIPGRWVCLPEADSDSLIRQPAVIIRRTHPVRGIGIVWLSEPRVTKKAVTRDVLLKKVKARGAFRTAEIISLKDRDAEAIAKLFR